MRMDSKSVLAGVFLLYGVEELLTGLAQTSLHFDLGFGTTGQMVVGLVGLALAWFLTKG